MHRICGIEDTEAGADDANEAELDVWTRAFEASEDVLVRLEALGGGSWHRSA